MDQLTLVCGRILDLSILYTQYARNQDPKTQALIVSMLTSVNVRKSKNHHLLLLLSPPIIVNFILYFSISITSCCFNFFILFYFQLFYIENQKKHESNF
jgi:hypothetical protein